MKNQDSNPGDNSKIVEKTTGGDFFFTIRPEALLQRG